MNDLVPIGVLHTQQEKHFSCHCLVLYSIFFVPVRPKRWNENIVHKYKWKNNIVNNNWRRSSVYYVEKSINEMNFIWNWVKLDCCCLIFCKKSTTCMSSKFVYKRKVLSKHGGQNAHQSISIRMTYIYIQLFEHAHDFVTREFRKP